MLIIITEVLPVLPENLKVPIGHVRSCSHLEPVSLSATGISAHQGHIHNGALEARLFVRHVVETLRGDLQGGSRTRLHYQAPQAPHAQALSPPRPVILAKSSGATVGTKALIQPPGTTLFARRR